MARANSVEAFASTASGRGHVSGPRRSPQEWWTLAKQTVFALLLVASFLIYYLVDKLIEALSLL